MPSIDTLTLVHMHDALVKEALLGSIGRSIAQRALQGRQGVQEGVRRAGRYIAQSSGDVGAGAGIGGMIGGAGGLGAGALEGYQEVDPETGQKGGVVGALSKGMKRGYQGALGGAAVGAAAGLGAGGRFTSSEAGRRLLAGSGANPLSAAARFGQRQLHGVTGLVPGGAKAGTEAYREGLRGMRIYGHDVAARHGEASNAVKQMTSRLQELKATGAPSKQVVRAEKALGKLQRGEKSLAAEAESVRKSWDTGMTSLPGLARAVGREGPKVLWERGLKPQWQHGGGLGKALLVGTPLMAAPELLKATDEEGRGRVERFGESLGTMGAFTTTPMIPYVGTDILARGVGKAGGLAGKGIDKLIGAVSGKKPQTLGESPGVPATDGDVEGGIPVERVMSNAAQGKPPEDLLV